MPENSQTDANAPDISVVVPVLNSEVTLPQLVGTLEATLEDTLGGYEVVLVDDGSHDNSWKVIQQLCAKSQLVRGIRLARNFGQHNALLCGVRAARGRMIVTLDDDLQNPPSEIPRLLEKLREGFDVVYGVPRREQHGLLRNLASRLTKWAIKSSMGVKVATDVSAFRAFRTSLRHAFKDYDSPSVSLDVLLSWASRRIGAVEVLHEQRIQGTSNYTIGKLVRHAFNLMTGFSALPLQLASLLGLVVTLFGAGILVYVIANWIAQGSAVPGFAFLASIITIFAGAQLLTLGVFGEYLARIHFRTLGKPPYAVAEVTDTQLTDDERPQ